MYGNTSRENNRLVSSASKRYGITTVLPEERIIGK